MDRVCSVVLKGNSRILSLIGLSVLFPLVACDPQRGERDAAPVDPPVGFAALANEPLLLREDTAAILAKPILASQDRDGRLFVADGSDRNVKVYAPDGQRLMTIGRAGRGPGEFSQLSDAQTYHDSVIAYDFTLARLSIFNSAGRFVRSQSMKPAPFSTRVIDDSLLLLIRHPAQGGKLLRIARLDGSVLAEFFERREYFENPKLRPLTAVFADGRDGRIFAHIFGDDSVFVFDYRGRLLGSGPIGSSAEITSFRTALRAHNGEVQSKDGKWFHDGARAVMKLVVISGGLAVMQVARYDTQSGTDILEGGEMLVVGVRDGVATAVGRTEMTSGLVGRDYAGAPIFFRYANAEATTYAIHTWVLK